MTRRSSPPIAGFAGAAPSDPHGTSVLVPRAATLDGFIDSTGAADGVNLRDVEPLTTLIVLTCNTRYRITVVRNTAVLVQGGRFFPSVTEAHVDGSSLGGSFLKLAWIGIGLRMEISADGQRIVTSPVRAITTERTEPPRRPH